MIKIIAILVSINVFANCYNEQSATRIGTHSRSIDEASGLTDSSNSEYLLWTNDSGDSSTIYQTSLDGSLLKSIKVKNFSNVDYESLERGPCPNNKAEQCLYLGDIGDGAGWRSSFKIAIIKESDVLNKSEVKPIKVINYRYPNGAENSEALISLDENTILIFSKDGSGIASIYELDISSEMIKLVKKIDLSAIMAGSRGKGARITDASYHRDTKNFLLLTYNEILQVSQDALLGQDPTSKWQRGVDYHLIRTPSEGLEQKETITYLSGSHDFILSSESPRRAASIYRFSCD